MLTIRAMAGGETYAAHHLSNNDYYAVGETVTGHWMGRGAELLGLEGAVTMEQFEAIRQGNDPTTGEFLRQRKERGSRDGTGSRMASPSPRRPLPATYTTSLSRLRKLSLSRRRRSAADRSS